MTLQVIQIQQRVIALNHLLIGKHFCIRHRSHGRLRRLQGFLFFFKGIPFRLQGGLVQQQLILPVLQGFLVFFQLHFFGFQHRALLLQRLTVRF